ncbi:plant UBX domain-containing protein 10-like [Vicia villosa]|uniref:plant UBX domain-containing protein 10-like n=1 Tax=Vicia villosa TaxID=3911 RepID=UPI00273CB96B|nr:plant UBX domain-containing protein 10-like [Vicia villosa]
MSSTARDHSMVRRMTNLPRSIMSFVGIGRRRRNQNANFPMQQQPLDSPQPQDFLATSDEWTFLNTFEQQYGTKHPFFYACRFNEAMKLAKQDQKFAFVYLHSPDHPFANVFCKETLCSELVIQFLDVNFVCWGGVADRGEGLKMASTLRPTSFPCCAVISTGPSDSIMVLQQVEGPVSPAELVEILQTTLEEQGVAFGSAKAKRDEKIQADRRLREEQDAAYFEALKIDKEKEKLRSLPSKEKVQIQKSVETQNIISNGKLKINSSEKKDKGIVVRGKETQVAEILIRFPNGERREHSFQCSDKIQSIFSYVDSLGLSVLGNYRLVSNFPKRVYGVDQMRMTLKDAGLYPKASLFLEPL